MGQSLRILFLFTTTSVILVFLWLFLLGGRVIIICLRLSLDFFCVGAWFLLAIIFRVRFVLLRTILRSFRLAFTLLVTFEFRALFITFALFVFFPRLLIAFRAIINCLIALRCLLLSF